jgi:hypothetical protein
MFDALALYKITLLKIPANFKREFMLIVNRKKLIVKIGRIAQLVEQQPFKLMVGGSNPSAPTL